MRATASAIHGCRGSARPRRQPCTALRHATRTTRRARRSGGAAHTRCDRTAAIAASIAGCRPPATTTSIGHDTGSPAADVAHRRPIAVERHLARDARRPRSAAARPATVRVAGQRAGPLEPHADRPAGTRRCRPAVIDPIGNGDAIDDLPARRRRRVEPERPRGGCRRRSDGLGERRARRGATLAQPPASSASTAPPPTRRVDDTARTTRRSHACRRAGVTSSGPASAATAAASSADAHREQRQILEQVAADRREPRRLKKPQRRKRQALGAPLDRGCGSGSARRPRRARTGRRVQPDHGVTAAAPAGNCAARAPAACR